MATPFALFSSAGDLLDARLHLGHHARREGLRNERAQLAMARRVHTYNARTDRADITILGWYVAALIRRKRRVITQHTCHIVVAEDVPCLQTLVEENWLRLTHLTIPVIRGRELFSIGLCLHNPSSFSFYDLILDWLSYRLSLRDRSCP